MTRDEALVEMDRQLELGVDVIIGPPELVYAAAHHGLSARTHHDDLELMGRGRGVGFGWGNGDGEGDGYGPGEGGGHGSGEGGGYGVAEGSPWRGGNGDGSGFGDSCGNGDGDGSWTHNEFLHGDGHVKEEQDDDE